ncbi:hypothetical protein PAECIP111802_06057 [Paenibacillus allorhizosphaerae]|uniref:Uncharacterized protein n=1 Tax=Paenibacillus allorhizosphaerae TaxID=2849866 RepID=A0ABM8VRH2_9BACL|nr:hypothetical protein PAECIP111802_06057 [Paenibacillus allorhizosphaerae]
MKGLIKKQSSARVAFFYLRPQAQAGEANLPVSWDKLSVIMTVNTYVRFFDGNRFKRMKKIEKGVQLCGY